MSSSPDPLTFVTSSPSKSAATRRSAKRAAAQPLTQLSPNVQRSDPFLDIPDLANGSPSKSITMTTPKAAGSSPWRIKVTVEPDNGFSQDENNLDSPTGARSARVTTTTTTIPLNDANGSSPVRRRGRPRKSDTLPATLEGVMSPTKKRGRPRKSDAAAASQSTSILLNDARDSSPVRKSGRPKKAEAAHISGRTRNGTPIRKPRKSVTRSPEASDVDSSLSDASYHPTKRSTTRGRRSMSQDIHVPEPIRAAAMYGPRSPDQFEQEMAGTQSGTSGATRSSIGQRRRSMRAASQLGEVASGTIEEEDAEEHEQTPKAASSKKATIDGDMWQSMVTNHEQEDSEQTNEEYNSSDDDLDIVMPDQTIGDTTMLHSEEFSMVSPYSLPSMQAALKGISSSFAQPAAPKISSFRTDPIPQTRRQQLSKQAISFSLPEINDSVASVSYMPSSPPAQFTASTPPRRQSPKPPSAPPAIQQVEISPSKAETPKLVNVVKAGIALQGIVNGNNRGSQDRRPSDDIREEAQRARLDEMFKQFQSGTRRELQAGLRLGEQLAERARSRTTSRESSHDEPEPDERPATPGSSAASDGDVFDGPSAGRTPTQDSSNHRLPTPEENDYSLPSPPPPPSQQLSQQPDLAVAPAKAQLISPARSDTSPDAVEMQDDSPEEDSVEKARSHENSGLQRRSEENYESHETISQMADEANPSQVIVLSSDHSESSEATSESSENVLDGDIWEEEGSREPESRFARRAKRVAAKRSGEKASASAAPSNSRRGTASRLSQRQSSSPPSDSTRAPGASNAATRSRNGAGRLSSRPQRPSRQESLEPASTSDPASEVESTENTGLFWQRSSETPEPRPIQHESNKLDLSVLMAIGDSPAKEIKEPVLATPPKLQPIRIPYNIGTGLNSPVKGSPLKQQVVFSSPSAVNSSPYQRIEHTIASSVLEDGDVMMIDEDNTRQLAQEDNTRTINGRSRVIPPSPAVFAEEDQMVQRQIENELTPRSARIKNLNLSGERKRLFTINEPAEQSESSIQVDQSSYLVQKQSEQSVKKPSRLNKPTSQLSTSKVGQTRTEEEQPTEPSTHETRSHMTALNLNKERRPLFEQSAVVEQKKPAPLFEQHAVVEQKKRAPLFEQKPLFQASGTVPTPAPKPAPQETTRSEEQQSAGLFGRLWGAVATSAEPESPQLPLHPLAQRYKHLPRIAPWTKTHWDTLDRIYQRYKRHPDEFSPNDPLHRALLSQKLQWQPDSSKRKPASDYAGVEMQNWNYTVKVTPELLVCCTIFMQLLTLKDAAEYRRATGKDIVRGNFMQKDKTGDPITLRDVIARMFGVVGGEMIRADEKRGICVRRDLDQFKLKYPWAPGWWDDMGNFLHY
ncbi:At DNA binding protein [Lasiodiplodia theobromae]|uniref:At DNA binding protein n=1 Tax=Lasiodiplodia theobromae TaxID=45133 RepID=UPI0015C3E8FB|nr:At DNA binding protein [Lasiodiplodia theobromae]KAF4544650.1 At DNA binding protein [Lasiodiplodia theobromae]